MFKRRRMQKTDYSQRMALLKSGRPRLIVRRALNNIHVQVVRYERDGDTVIAETISKELKEHGWLAHGGSTPSAYLAGLLAGLKARKLGVDNAVVDLGLQTSVKGSSLYAAVLGAKDAGINVPVGKEALPDIERVRGQHIAKYAALLKKDQAKYKRQFSSYIKNNLDPENLPEHFEEVKGKILAALGIGLKNKKIMTTAGGQSVDEAGEPADTDNEEWEDN